MGITPKVMIEAISVGSGQVVDTIDRKTEVDIIKMLMQKYPNYRSQKTSNLFISMRN